MRVWLTMLATATACTTGLGPTAGYGSRHGWFAGVDASGGAYNAQAAGSLVDSKDGFAWTLRADALVRNDCHSEDGATTGWMRVGLGVAEDRDGVGGSVEVGAEGVAAAKHGPVGRLLVGLRYAREWQVVATAQIGHEQSQSDCHVQ